MRLCGPATLGEKNDWLRIAVFPLLIASGPTGVIFTVLPFEVRVFVAAARDRPELVLTGVFLRLCVFGITRTHFSGE